VRQKGKVTSWNDDKGFGFLTPIGGGKQVFIHIKAFKSRNTRPKIDQIVSFNISKDNQGRVCAENATRLGDTPHKRLKGQKSHPLIKYLLLIILLGFGVFGYLENTTSRPHSFVSEILQSTSPLIADRISSNTRPIETAYQNHQSNLQVGGQGEVIRILPDDNDGSRHQKFIIRLSSGQTLLISHNIDLASRISGLSKRDNIEFYGEYEWNSKGGVVHWTHHDPNGHHEDGWLKHNGRTYK
jgi:cold shock CspA family protein